MLPSKKGLQLVWNMLLNLIIVLLASVLFIIAATNLHSNADYLVDYYAQDLALLVEAVQAVPGDVSVTYPLEKGFIFTLEEEQVVIRHDEENEHASKRLHTLKGVSIEPNRATGLVVLAKTDGKITINDDGPPEPVQRGCPPAMVASLHLPFTIHATRGTSDPAALDKERLQGIVDTIEYQARAQNGLAAADSAKLALTVSSRQPSTGRTEIILRRPQATDATETNYQHLFCEFVKRLEEKPYTVKEELTAPAAEHYQAELIFAPTPQEQQQLFTDRPDIIRALIGAVEGMGPEATP
jgi:hypothetical protein